METVILDWGNVKVTDSRFIVGAQTYAIRNLTSVRSGNELPKRFWPVVGLIIGLMCLFGQGSLQYGVFITLVAGIILWQQKPDYWVILQTAGGEVRALVHKDPAAILPVVEAINRAMTMQSNAYRQ